MTDDPRVDAIATGLCSLIATIPVEVAVVAAAKGEIALPAEEFAKAAFAGLEADGWVVTKLEPVGVQDEAGYLHDRGPKDEGDELVYVMVDS